MHLVNSEWSAGVRFGGHSKQVSLEAVSFNDALTATQFLLGGDRVALAAFSGRRNKFAGCHVTFLSCLTIEPRCQQRADLPCLYRRYIPRFFLGQQLREHLPVDIVFGFSKMPFEDDQFFAVYEFFHSVLLSKGARVWVGDFRPYPTSCIRYHQVGFSDCNLDGRIGPHRTLLDPWCCRRRDAKGTSKV